MAVTDDQEQGVQGVQEPESLVHPFQRQGAPAPVQEVPYNAQVDPNAWRYNEVRGYPPVPDGMQPMQPTAPATQGPALVQVPVSSQGAQVAGITDEQAAYIEYIDGVPTSVNRRYQPDTLAALKPGSIAWINNQVAASKAGVEGVEHSKHRVEILPDRPGAFTVWIIPTKALDTMLMGKVQGAIQRSDMNTAQDGLYTYLENSIYSWNSSDALNRRSIDAIEGGVALAMFERITQEALAWQQARAKKP